MLLAGCSPLDAINALSPNDGTVSVGSFSYGEHAKQRLDLYAPVAPHEKPLPTVLFLYGGSWKDGDRADYAFVGRALAREGFLVAVADYRTFPEIRFPDFVHDAAMATAWLHRHAAGHGGDARRIHLIGHSAGAHIAAMVALDPTYLKAQGLDRTVLGRWVGLAGPYAFHPSHFASIRDVFQHLQDEDQARPITFADADAPPALLLHGAADTTVVPAHSTRLADTLNAVGAEAHVRLYPDVTHGPLVASLASPLRWLAPTFEDVVRYLKSGARR